MDDAGDLGAVERATRVQAQQHRRARLLLLAEEAVLVRQRQVDARVLHRGERGDRARQLAFEAALEGQPLLELGLAEARAVHQLVAGHRALRQAGRRHLQAQVGHLAGRDEDRAARSDPVRHVHLRELGDDRAAVLVGEVAVEHPELAVAGVRRQRIDDGGEGDETDRGAGLGPPGHRLDAARERQGHRHGLRGIEGDAVFHRCSRSAGHGGPGMETIIRRRGRSACTEQPD